MPFSCSWRSLNPSCPVLKGKTSVDWFYGFKLHLLLNDRGELIWFQLTAGNVDDRKSLYEMIVSPNSEIFGKIFGDKGYLSRPLFEKLLREHHIQLVTGLKKNMHTWPPDRFYESAPPIRHTFKL